MIYHLPTIKSTEDGFTYLAEFAGEARRVFNDTVELDFSRCGFFDANMAAPLAAVLARIADKFNRIQIVNVPHPIKNILSKNRFLIDYGYGPVEDVNHTTLPFIRIQRSSESRFTDYLSSHMNGKGIPRMTAAMSKRFRQSVFEVFQNAVIHSESQLGIFVCGQFYPQLQRLDLTIADAGVGVRTNVRRYLENEKISSVRSLKWALQEGHTTKTGRQPGGMGLKFLRDFIELNGGKIQLVSRFGYYEYNKGSESFVKLAADFRGTAVNLEINTGDTSTYQLSSEISSQDIF